MWVQADLGEVKELHSITTQGDPRTGTWLRQYVVSVSIDGINAEASRTLSGNTDAISPVTHEPFQFIQHYRFVRLTATDANFPVSFRWDLTWYNVYSKY